MTILIGLLRFGEKNNNTILFFYFRYLNKNLIVLRGLSYLWLLVLYICDYLAKKSNNWVNVFGRS